MPAIRLVSCVAALFLGGCASSIPENIRSAPSGPGVGEVRADPERHAGARVRWGGTISDVRNLEDRTVIAVVARPVTGDGEPYGKGTALGRFFAEVDHFLDPEEYSSGRRITVVGRVTGIRCAPIDQYMYDYPVVQVAHLYMWREYARRDPYRHGPYYRPFPYWHDPYWHDPFWPHRRGFRRGPWHYW